MPKLSLYHPTKSSDYKYFDRIVSQMFTAGATDLYIHKYLGPKNEGPSNNFTEPQYDVLSPTNIQDLLFLENRDRKYATDIYRLRGHYNVQNLDFDLSQFGLFLNNDIIFITVHYNDMIDIVGRKLMVGDVIELPHLLDYNPLDETIQYALKRFYQITDANYASEGFSPTWYPHLWRIKCEPLVNSQEFADILNQPNNKDNYLGDWEKDKTYPPGYTVSFGDKIYESIKDVPAGTSLPNSEYWVEKPNDSLADIMSTYKKNIEINNKVLDEAKRLVPKSGYNQGNLYIVPTYGIKSGKYDQPAPPINIVASNVGQAAVIGSVVLMKDPKYKNPSMVIKVKKEQIKSIWDMTADMDFTEKLDKFVQVSLEQGELEPVRTDTNSGPVSGEDVLIAQSLGVIVGPYGTADNTYATADQNPEAPGFTGTEPYGPNTMDYRADCDPRFQYIARSSPRSFGYTTGYLTGDGTAPNGEPFGTGISFPSNPKVGDYFLRIDYFPSILYRWDGNLWIRISENVRTGTGFDETDQSQLSGFINNDNTTVLTDGNVIPQAQSLSTILTIAPDDLPPSV
jgi:hypothetical protein